MYAIRLWLSGKCFRLGRALHPDIARLHKEILETQKRMSMGSLLYDLKEAVSEVEGKCNIVKKN